MLSYACDTQVGRLWCVGEAWIWKSQSIILRFALAHASHVLRIWYGELCQALGYFIRRWKQIWILELRLCGHHYRSPRGGSWGWFRLMYGEPTSLDKTRQRRPVIAESCCWGQGITPRAHALRAGGWGWRGRVSGSTVIDIHTHSIHNIPKP